MNYFSPSRLAHDLSYMRGVCITEEWVEGKKRGRIPPPDLLPPLEGGDEL